MPVRIASVVVTACLVSAATAGPASARAAKDRVPIRWGLVAAVSGTGCAPATLARATSARELLRFDPGVGTEVGDFESVTVTGATLSGGLVAWTMQPAADECNNDSSSIWSTEERSWSVTHRASMYTIRASRLGGVRSIAGFA